MLRWVYVAGGVAVLVALLVVITRRRKGIQKPAGAPPEKKAGRFCSACGARL